jgi:hypothetical protein
MIDIHGTLRTSPIRAVFYGSDGVGKSTLCAAAPGAVFINLEDGGLDHIDARAVKRPESWAEIIDAVDALAEYERCGSIVIDSLDWAEQICWSYVCEMGDDKGRKMRNIEAFGFGKGYVAAVNEWRNLLAALARAGQRGKHVLLTAHAARKMVKNPSGEDYEQWQIKLHERAAGVIREWVHIVAFAELDIATVTEKDDGGRTKAHFTGKRILRTQPGSGYQGKSRLALPPKIPLDWSAFFAAVSNARPPSLDALTESLASKLAALDDVDIAKGCDLFLRDRGRTIASLSEAISTVDAYLDEKKKKEG